MKTRDTIVAALCLSLGACAETGQGPSPVGSGAHAGQRNGNGAPVGQLARAPQSPIEQVAHIPTPDPRLDPQNPHFAYVVQTDKMTQDGRKAEQLRLAVILDPSASTGPTATDFKTAPLIDTVNLNGDAVLFISRLWVSPGNQRFLTVVDETDFQSDFDKDLNAYNMADGTPLAFVNELTIASTINSHTCPSQEFDNYRAGLQAQGISTAGLDFSVPLTNPQIPNVLSDLPEPVILGWLDDTRLALSWTFPLLTTDNTLLQPYTFQLIVTWPQGGGPATYACTSQPPSVPNPPTALSVGPGRQSGLGPIVRPDSTIRLHGTPVKWLLLSPPTSIEVQIPAPRAEYVAGVIWP